MKKSVKKVMKTTAILLLALIFAGSPAISPITSKTTIEAEASAKSNKAVKNARKCYYSTRKNLRRYKKVRNGSTSTDYWSKNKLVFSEIKPDKWDFLSIKIQFVSITIQKANWYLHLLTRKREER